MTVAVVTDSTASLDPDDAAREGITVVPTTVIIGSSGNVLTEPFSGAMDYDGWTALIEGLL